MKETHAIEAKRIRIHKVKNIVAQMGKVELGRLCAICSINLGLSHEKTKEYIEDLEDQGILEIDGDIIKEKKEEKK